MRRSGVLAGMLVAACGPGGPAAGEGVGTGSTDGGSTSSPATTTEGADETGTTEAPTGTAGDEPEGMIRIEGQSPSGLSGYAIGAAGDVNGDGLADLLVYEKEDGIDDGLYVVFGAADLADTRLDDIASGQGGFVVTGKFSYIYPAPPPSGVGDFDGDGLSDFVATALNPGTDTLSAYVIFGSPSGQNSSTSDLSAGIGGFEIAGAVSIARAGDVNGDGAADVAGVDSQGRAFVVFGGSARSDTLVLDQLDSTTGLLIEGANPRLAQGAGDVNEDGFADVAVAENSGPYCQKHGRIRILLGGPALTNAHVDDLDVGVGGCALTGEHEEDLGVALTAADVDGDGFDELVAGAPYDAGLCEPSPEESAGHVYVVSECPDPSPASVRDAQLVLRIKGEPRSNEGNILAAGDLDSDGVDDVVLGSRASSANGGVFGKAHVVFGGEGAPVVDLGEMTAPLLELVGSTGENFGHSVAVVGDMNGDGHSELAASAPGRSPAGRTYVFFGPLVSSRQTYIGRSTR